MTGPIDFSDDQTFPSSLTANYLLKSGGTMTGTLTTDQVTVPSGKTITVNRGSNNTSVGGLDIKGFSPSQVGLLTDIFAVSYGNGTSTGDSINYKGRTDGSNNLQTKYSVQQLISNSAQTGFVPLTGGEMTGELTIDIPSTAPNNVALEIEEDGNTNFRFKAGDLSFKSVDYEYLVISGARARFKGRGKVNGGPDLYQFKITALDSDVNRNDAHVEDTFRIQIWGDNGVLYDNGRGADDATGDGGTTALGGGSISIKDK